MLKKFFLLLFFVFLSSCSTAPEKEEVKIWEIKNVQASKLWLLANKAIKNNKITKADEHLTRAATISPKNPIILSKLAEIKLMLKKSLMAENLAAKSNYFSKKDKTINYRNWLIIEHARKQRGDITGVKEAQLQLNKISFQ
jgi:Tfp pilus assembly protein PilF